MDRQCPECGDLIKGRIDKKFCSDQCRNNYNNKLKSEDVNLIRNVNNILRKNRRILAEMAPAGKTKVTEKQLYEKGFNFSFFTNTYVTKNGNVYKFCYEYGYLELEGGWFALVKKEEYV